MSCSEATQEFESAEDVENRMSVCLPSHYVGSLMQETEAYFAKSSRRWVN